MSVLYEFAKDKPVVHMQPLGTLERVTQQETPLTDPYVEYMPEVRPPAPPLIEVYPDWIERNK